MRQADQMNQNSSSHRLFHQQLIALIAQNLDPQTLYQLCFTPDKFCQISEPFLYLDVLFSPKDRHKPQCLKWSVIDTPILSLYIKSITIG
ncbi:hypothetical protein CC78DRAFT_235291 [Lojkania enalia]|uniref:Uncharacterized protein n=1 Tax=Lojkania enalia TaxID=147567 RepID=A0A9P4N6A3_9PLEO|nr:hypothetical protein CC78DRAFT_235291 [Didymosphaeria enalia]